MMKINNWTVDKLIDYLKLLKTSDLFDYHCVPRCFGELHFFNGEDKKTGEFLYATIDEIIDGTEG